MSILENDDNSPEGILSIRCERAFLVGIQQEGNSPTEAEALLDELKLLTYTLGIEVCDCMMVRIKQPQIKFYTGSGKAEEIRERAKEAQADLIIFDRALSPSQQRNLEQLGGLTVIDRHEVILDIFSKRARSRQAVLQTDLARMEYMLPRLKRAWTHLSRQRGGARGTRGEGEKQIEVDRRSVLKQITAIKKELTEVRKQHQTQRKKRQSVPVPLVSLVGYTNAGKSSLMHQLTEADVLREDKLFATLDTTTRKLHLKSKRSLLLTDTVGFIRNLPHDLIEAFKSTLEETVLASFLLHVLDASAPDIKELEKTTLSVLQDLGIADKPRITVINKTDLLEKNGLEHNLLKREYPEAVFISCRTGEGMDTLLNKLEAMLDSFMVEQSYRIPLSRYDLISRLHKEGRVLEEKHQDNAVEISVLIDPAKTPLFQEFRLEN